MILLSYFFLNGSFRDPVFRSSFFSGDGLTCLFDFRRWAVSSSFLFDFNAKFAIGRLFVTLCIPVGSLSRGILLEVSMYALR